MSEQNWTIKSNLSYDPMMGISTRPRLTSRGAATRERIVSAAAELMYEQANTGTPDRAWVCVESGRIYAHWMPFAPPHNSFNTIVWEDPSQARREPSIITALPDQGDALQLIESRAA